MSLIASGLVSLVLGLFFTVPLAAAEEPIEVRTLINQRIELLPQGPLCWDVRRGSLAPAGRSPAGGYHAHAMVISYVIQGTERLEYAGGPARTLNQGDGDFVGQNNWHLHESIGPVPRTNVVFELTCQPQPNAVGNSGTLPEVRPGVPYQVQLRERRWPVGSQTPVHELSGTTTTYVLEGIIAQASTAAVKYYESGSIYVVPPNTTGQNTSVGSVPARTLDVDLWPTGEERSRTLTGVFLPSPAQVGLPRTGDELSWAPVAVLLGALFLAVGLGLRWAKA